MKFNKVISTPPPPPQKKKVRILSYTAARVRKIEQLICVALKGLLCLMFTWNKQWARNSYYFPVSLPASNLTTAYGTYLEQIVFVCVLDHVYI
jgi:hypothetical protein